MESPTQDTGATRGYAAHKDQVLKRLRRIEGQVRALTTAELDQRRVPTALHPAAATD